jgi:hypothetical protein
VDHEDVRHLVLKNRSMLDLGYIRRWLAEFHLLAGHEQILDDFESLAGD